MSAPSAGEPDECSVDVSLHTHKTRHYTTTWGYKRSKKTWCSGGPVDTLIGAINKDKRSTQGNGQGKGKGKSHEPRNNEKSKSDRKCSVCGKPGHFAEDCHHLIHTVNEVIKTAPVSTPIVCDYRTWTLGESCVQPKHFCHTWLDPRTHCRLPQMFSLHGKQHETHGWLWSSNSCLSKLVRFLTTLCIHETVVTQK